MELFSILASQNYLLLCPSFLCDLDCCSGNLSRNRARFSAGVNQSRSWYDSLEVAHPIMYKHGSERYSFSTLQFVIGLGTLGSPN